MIERSDHRVVERGAAARINALQRFLQFFRVVGEIFVEVEVELIVEVDDEHLILRIAGFHERQRRRVHLRALLAHASAVVHHQAHRDGDVLAPKNGYFLLGFVFEDPEILFLQVGNERAFRILDGRVQHDEIDILFEGVALLAGRLA